MGIYIIAAGAAVFLVGGVFSTYQLYKLVQTDATCRGIKSPRLWGALAAGGNNQSGIVLYLIYRRRYPIISITSEQQTFMDKCKKKIAVGLMFLVVGIAACIWGAVFLE
ncbi:MAG: hypothetical protein K2J77_00115 [Oscillospiraceae bacterium]|nr:hypothetical protein [Oscillospiraceae bacterium]